VDYYQNLLENPPFVYSKKYSDENLPFLNMIYAEAKEFNIPIGYNIGLNMKNSAGQREEHIHFHIFPRYKSGKGVVNAMRKNLYPDLFTLED
jgi:diadenosine tetraphosphate (Ap4A) HIT family hydrolase